MPTARRTRPDSFTYILGDSPKETERLRAQAALWDPVSHALFDRIGLPRRQASMRKLRSKRILEIGPGYGSLHMELRLRNGAPIDAVERSPVFAQHLRDITARDRLGAGNVMQCDLIDAPLPPNFYDVIFARWVFLFLPDPLAHIRKLVRALKPGGVLAIQDYHRETFDMVPRPAAWAAFLAADRVFFASQGGDVSIGSKLPTLYRRAGLAIESITPTLRVGQPGSATWEWVTTYSLGIMPRYATLGPLSKPEAQQLVTEWRRAGRSQATLLIAPTLLDVVGRKPKPM